MRLFSFTSKDLINIGIFGALYAVLSFALGALGAINPIMQLVGTLLAVVANGIVLMVFFTKINHPGPILLLVLLVALVRLGFGDAWTGLITALLTAVIAEILVYVGKYRNLNLNAVAYAFIAMAPTGSMLPMVYMSDEYFNGVEKQMGAEYAHEMAQFFTPTMVLSLFVVTFLVGLIGAFIGKAIVIRNFARFDKDVAGTVESTEDINS